VRTQASEKAAISAGEQRIPELVRSAVARLGWRVGNVNSALNEFHAEYEKRERVKGINWQYAYRAILTWESSGDEETELSVQVTLENHDHALKPGMFAKIEIILPTKQKTLVVPGTAVSYAPYGNSVYVIEKKKDAKTGKESHTIRQAFVRVGEARGDFVSITQGLKPGETVVGTGVFKLRNGMAVTINNDLAPKPQINPTPTDS